MVRNVTDLLSSVTRRPKGDDDGPTSRTRETCLVCGAGLVDSELFAEYRICGSCRFHYSMTARERINTLADPATFRETNRSVTSLDPLSFSTRTPYKKRLFRDQRRTGLTEAAVTGTCAIGGSPVVLIVLDFGSWAAAWGASSARRWRWHSSTPRRTSGRGGHRDQRRLAHPGGRPLADADGQDQHHHGEAG